MPFTTSVDTPLPPAEAWGRVTDWPEHGRYVPLTTVSRSPGEGVGSGFVARTGVGRAAFDDPMVVVTWEPPRFCRVEKRGSVIRGWAELTVEPRGSGSRVTWREEAIPARLPRLARGISTAAGRRLFGRVLRRLLS